MWKLCAVGNDSRHVLTANSKELLEEYMKLTGKSKSFYAIYPQQGLIEDLNGQLYITVGDERILVEKRNKQA